MSRDPFHDADDALTRGARLFDCGKFFEAHEAWEDRWRVTTDPTEKLFLQGLIQIAAGFHKLIAKRSAEPASRLFAKGLAKLDACPDDFGGVSMASFRDGVRACAKALGECRFDASAIPRLGR